MIYDTINPKIVSFIDEEVDPHARILDVGCATGKLGRELKAKFNCYIIGIEIDDLATELAQNYCDNIIIIDLLSLNFYSNWPKVALICINMVNFK